jgi:alanine-synthesizing transaminase
LSKRSRASRYNRYGMFSSRFHWDFRPNRLTQLLARKRSEGAQVLDLTESNPTRAGIEYPAAIARTFEDDRVLRYEPSAAGMASARAAVSRYYADRGHDVPVERILLTASTSEAYAYLFKLLADPGDHVLVPRPSYPLFEFLATMEHVGVRQYPLAYHGSWSIAMDELAAMIDAHTKAIVLVNPNNPTGSYVKPAEAEALERLGVPLISDEVFADYGVGLSMVNTEECLTFTMNGLSKSAGLPQMKLGWIVVSGPDAQRREAMEKLEWIADTYLSVSTPVQCAAERLIEAGAGIQRQIRSRTAENLAVARGVLAGSAADVLNVEAGWNIVVRVPRVRSEEEWTLELLDREDVLVQPGFFYDFETEAFLVLSVLTPPAMFREGIGRLGATIAKGTP